jgi:hypothetical protein
MSFNMNLRGATGAGIAPSQSGNIIPKGHRYGQLNQFTPGQHDVFARQQEMAGPDSYLSRLAGGDPQLFEQMEAPAFRQFQALQGNIASRFSQAGARKSSGFQNTINQASQDFAAELQSRRMDYQRQAMGDLRGLYEEILGQRPYEQFIIQNAPKKPSFFQKLLGGSSSVAGAGFGGLFGGLPGAKIGASAGSALGKAFF